MTSTRFVLVALLAGVSGGVAHAQPAPAPSDPDSPALAEARRLYAEGNEHYSAGRYTLAAERFLKAYELSGKPALLFNLANTYERAGNYEKAAQYLRMYLTGGEVHDEAAVKARLQRLELAADQAKKDAEKSPAPAPVVAKVDDKREEPVAPVVVHQPSRVPYYLAGAGFIAGGAVAVVFGLRARDERSEIDGLCSQQGGGVICPPSAASHLDNERRYALYSDIGLGVAAASVATSVVYYFVTRNKDAASEPSRQALSIVPAAGGVGVGVVATGRF
jgi:tetratricopeptide (TPR) repeat protein